MNKSIFLSLIVLITATTHTMEWSKHNNKDHVSKLGVLVAAMPRVIKWSKNQSAKDNNLDLSVFNIPQSSIFAPSKLGKIQLLHDDNNDFYILWDNKYHNVKNYFIDQILRNITTEQLKVFLNAGYIAISQMDDGEFSLKARVRGLGGGPVTAAVFSGLTKALCYGTAAAALGAGAATIGTAAVAAAGVVAGASGAVVAGGAVAGTTAMVAAETAIGVAMSTTGATAVAGALTVAGATEGAALVTIAGVTSTGGLAGAITMIEGASTLAFIFGMWLPLP